jgi:hypothetical protein
MRAETFAGLHVKCPLLSDFSQNCNVSTIVIVVVLELFLADVTGEHLQLRCIICLQLSRG